MNPAHEAMVLLPRRIRPGVHDVDTRPGRLLLDLYSRTPQALDGAGWPCAVITWATRRPQVILDDGQRIEWSPREAADAVIEGTPRDDDAAAAIAWRFTLARLIKRTREASSDASNPYAYVSFHRPTFGELVEQHTASATGEDVWVDLQGQAHIVREDAWSSYAAEHGRAEVMVMRRRWAGASDVVRRRVRS